MQTNADVDDVEENVGVGMQTEDVPRDCQGQATQVDS